MTSSQPRRAGRRHLRIPTATATATVLTLAITLSLTALAGCGGSSTGAGRASPSAATTTTASPTRHRTKPPTTVRTVPGMPPVHDPTNLYRDAGAGDLAPFTRDALPRVYVPNGLSGTVSVIDPRTRKVVDTFAGGRLPQHIVPAYDGRRLWVLDNTGNALIPIDPTTARPGAPVPVDDPYNLYFTPDGREAIVVAEDRQRLDFRDPLTMALRSSLALPCKGLNHLDVSIDGRYAIATCEFAGALVKIDLVGRRLVARLDLAAHDSAVHDSGHGSMPQDVRISPDGRTFYVADMMRAGVWVLDGDSFTVTGFIPTGVGAHGLYPSRDGRSLYVANRGWDTVAGGFHGPGSVSVIRFSTNRVTATWSVPGGGSPDMGNVSADGRELWLAGRYDAEVYVFDTTTGALAARIPVGLGPHGLTVWPQPGRYSLGHTGNMR